MKITPILPPLFFEKRFVTDFKKKAELFNSFFVRQCTVIKGCVRYAFASFFFKSKKEHLRNKEKCFLFHFKSSFRSRENQISEFLVFKFHEVIKCQSTEQEILFTGKLGK